MTQLRDLLIAACTTLVFINSSCAQETKNGLTWYTDMKQAHKLSQQTKKPIFAFFTGSDWCGWCHKLEAAVFNKPGFQAWAKKNVILVELDFPRRKQLPDSLMQQNQQLAQVLGIQGYPTVWLLFIEQNGDKFNLKPLGKLGYPTSEPGKEEETFIQQANALINTKS